MTEQSQQFMRVACDCSLIGVQSQFSSRTTSVVMFLCVCCVLFCSMFILVWRSHVFVAGMVFIYSCLHCF